MSGKPTKMKPKGCKCERHQWGRTVDPICEEFVLNARQGYCLNCAHAKECHKTAAKSEK